MKWISVKDELPNNGQIVLVILRHTLRGLEIDPDNKWSPMILMYQNTWEPDITCWWKVGISDDGQIRGFDRYIISTDYWRNGKIYYLGNEILYWMPIPEIPKKK